MYFTEIAATKSFESLLTPHAEEVIDDDWFEILKPRQKIKLDFGGLLPGELRDKLISNPDIFELEITDVFTDRPYTKACFKFFNEDEKKVGEQINALIEDARLYLVK